MMKLRKEGSWSRPQRCCLGNTRVIRMENMTAKVSGFARAYHYKNNRIRIFSDNIAEKLLGDDYNQIAKSLSDGIDFFCPGFEGTKEDGLRLILDRQLSPSVLGRSAFCEDKLLNAIADGCKQYLVFAAGYDTYALRCEDKSITVFELDYPQMLNDKTERIRKAKLITSAVNVPCDLADVTWKDKLLTVGYGKKQKAFGSLLGISYYLEKADFEQLLSGVSEIMAIGSAICFDYPSVDESAETRKTQMLATAAGEQMKARYSYEEMEKLLQKYGFALTEHLDAEKMTDKYFTEYNQENPGYQMQSPIGIGYAYAVKSCGEGKCIF